MPKPRRARADPSGPADAPDHANLPRAATPTYAASPYAQEWKPAPVRVDNTWAPHGVLIMGVRLLIGIIVIIAGAYLGKRALFSGTANNLTAPDGSRATR